MQEPRFTNNQELQCKYHHKGSPSKVVIIEKPRDK